MDPVKKRQAKRNFISQSHGKNAPTADDLAEIARDSEEYLHVRRAAFELIDQRYRHEINLEYPIANQPPHAMKTAITDEMTSWIMQLRRHAEGIAELHRVWKCGGHHEREQARNWINNFHKDYLETAIVGIMKLADITPAEITERHEHFDDSEYRVISHEPDMP